MFQPSCQLSSYEDSLYQPSLNEDLETDKKRIIIPKSKAPISICKELEVYKIPEYIRIKADEISKKIKIGTMRKKNRKLYLFFCCYNAHLELCVDIDPIKYAKDYFGLKSDLVGKIHSLFSPTQTGYEPPERKPKTAHDLIKIYAPCLSISSEVVPDIQELVDKVLNIDENLKNSSPRTLAGAILQYYMITNGIEIDDSNLLSDIVTRSAVTIDTLYRKISQILNSQE